MSRTPSGGGRGGVLGTLLRYELKMLVRDTRTVLIAVVAPLVLFPALVFVMRFAERADEQRLEETTYMWAVTGSEAAFAEGLVRAALELPATDTLDGDAYTFRRTDATAGLDSLVREGELHVLVRGMRDGEYRAELEAEAADTTGSDARDDGPPVPVLRLEYQGSSDLAREAAGVLDRRLERLREARSDSVFRATGFPVDPDRVAAVQPENIASAAREGGALLGLWLTPFLLFLMLSGGSIVAADAISGEKERGTLETLLTSSAERSEIVDAKLLAVVIVGLVVAVVNVANLVLYLVLGLLELPPELALDLSFLDVGLVLAMLTPLTLLVAASLLLLSGFAKSYKEYQIYFFPLFLIFLLPSLAAVLPGIELRSVIALIPVSGVGVAVREIMVGEYDWPFLVLAFLSTGGAAWYLARLAEKTLSTERLISGAELEEADLTGGPALFPRHVLAWFAGLWVTFFVTSLWLGGDLGIRGQVVLNLVGIFLGGSILMIRRYRLPLRETLALRPVHPAIWLAVLVGAPSALVTGVGLAELVNTFVFPVPQEVIEAFGESLVGDELPVWQTVFFLAVLPGVLEEIAFRGVLLHGLSKRLGPVALCLAVGAIFGLFHVSLFRIAPTGYLGVILAASVVLTGSIYPAMLWHFLNNAVAIVPAQLGWMDVTSGIPWWAYPLAVVGLLLAFTVMVRWGSGYPGLGGGRAGRRRAPAVPAELPAG